MTLKATRCFLCDGTLSQVTEKAEISLGQRSAVVDVTRSRCNDCGEIFYTPDQMDAAQRAVAEELRHQEGLLGPMEIREIREKYRLTQAQFEQLLGIGPKTVVRWERGTVCQNRTADELLRIIRDIPEAFEYLARKNSVSVDLAESVNTFGDLSQALKHALAFQYVRKTRMLEPVRMLVDFDDLAPLWSSEGWRPYAKTRQQHTKVNIETEAALPAIPKGALK
jgi:HTH-type transcriptional regulator/antitoxin MqsA